MYNITYNPINILEIIKSVKEDEGGAIVTFIGTVRNENKGRKVRYLLYEAYEEMAIPIMKEIAEEAKLKWNLKKIAITHRIGKLEIGDESIVIAVSSTHRDEGFKACHFIIDKIKEIVPIWKKEYFEGGEEWIEEG